MGPRIILTWVLEVLLELVSRLLPQLEDDKGLDGIALDLIGVADDRCLGDTIVTGVDGRPTRRSPAAAAPAEVAFTRGGRWSDRITWYQLARRSRWGIPRHSVARARHDNVTIPPGSVTSHDPGGVRRAAPEKRDVGAEAPVEDVFDRLPVGPGMGKGPPFCELATNHGTQGRVGIREGREQGSKLLQRGDALRQPTVLVADPLRKTE
jgi:hypothetical protein